jgi:hypothetical protein
MIVAGNSRKKKQCVEISRDSNRSARLAAADTSEASSRMIARGLTQRGFPVGLRVGHSLSNALHDLFFGKAGIFQAADFRAAHGGLALQAAVQNQIHRAIREPHQAQHNSIAADDIELFAFCDFQNHRLRVARARQIDCGIRAGEKVVMLASIVYQSEAGLVTDPRLFQFYKLRHFRVGSIQRFKLLDVAGEHSGLVQRTIIRERMVIASTYPEESDRTEKHELVPHDSIVSGAMGRARECVVRDTRRKDRLLSGRKADG